MYITVYDMKIADYIQIQLQIKVFHTTFLVKSKNLAFKFTPKLQKIIYFVIVKLILCFEDLSFI